jgi:hypothetical protein
MASCFRPQCSSNHCFHKPQRTKIWSKLFQTGTDGRVFSMRVKRLYSRVKNFTNKFSLNYLNFRNIPSKLSRAAKQYPSNSAHLMTRFVRGVSIYVHQFFIPEPNSRRVPRVGRVWLAQAHTQAFQTPPST